MHYGYARPTVDCDVVLGKRHIPQKFHFEGMETRGTEVLQGYGYTITM